MKNKLVTHFKKLGNSNCIVIPKPIIKLLGIDLSQDILVQTDGEKLIITPNFKTNQ